MPTKSLNHKIAAFKEKLLGRFGEGSIKILELPNIGKVVRKRWYGGITPEIADRVEFMRQHPSIFPKVHGSRGKSTYFEFVEGVKPDEVNFAGSKAVEQIKQLEKKFNDIGLRQVADSARTRNYYRKFPEKRRNWPDWEDTGRTTRLGDISPKNMVMRSDGDIKVVDMTKGKHWDDWGSTRDRLAERVIRKPPNQGVSSKA